MTARNTVEHCFENTLIWCRVDNILNACTKKVPVCEIQIYCFKVTGNLKKKSEMFYNEKGS